VDADADAVPEGEADAEADTEGDAEADAEAGADADADADAGAGSAAAADGPPGPFAGPGAACTVAGDAACGATLSAGVFFLPSHQPTPKVVTIAAATSIPCRAVRRRGGSGSNVGNVGI
jgi:hypothetical protein